MQTKNPHFGHCITFKYLQSDIDGCSGLFLLTHWTGHLFRNTIQLSSPANLPAWRKIGDAGRRGWVKRGNIGIPPPFHLLPWLLLRFLDASWLLALCASRVRRRQARKVFCMYVIVAVHSGRASVCTDVERRSSCFFAFSFGRTHRSGEA